MKIKQVQLKFKRGSDVSTLIWTADWHYGNQCVDIDALACLSDRIRSIGCQWIHGADAIEGITPTDKRFDITEKTTTIMEQIQDAISLIKPISKNCIGMLKGNHESKASAIVGDITDHICKGAGIDNLSQTCFLETFAPHGSSNIFASHYIQSITNRNEDPLVREANKASRLRKLSRVFDLKLKLFAHIHKFLCHPPISEDRLMLVNGQLKHRPASVFDCWCVICPSFLKIYTDDNYAQARLMEPVDIGWSEIDHDKQCNIVEVRNVLGDGTTKRAYHPILAD